MNNLIRDINYLRGKEGARVFFKMNSGQMTILAKANKANEQTVIIFYTKFTVNEEVQMRIKKIVYPTPLSQIADIENDNIDVFIELEDETNISVVVCTPKNLISYMAKENINFIPASPPDIIVKSLTEENIEQAINNYAQEDAFWLKLFFVAGIDKTVIDLERIDLCLKEIKRVNRELLNDYN
ncbi:hypothetical protein P4H71_03325 [Paenibacillus kribbensis]|uniref:hypothetical protein n=1 Tax=Paenibacillus kribbensis TaxID=172713 RepID=UPI002DBB354A|nr:hypothetical protein [Paenibacillus kribbensis]MEC0233384.1 hypothetical protein [Paenibacillus kribbensis]